MKKSIEIDYALEQDLLLQTKKGLESLIDMGWLNASDATNAIFEDIDNALETLKE